MARFEPGVALRIDGDRVVERGSALEPVGDERVVDLGDAAVVPGWINAHAHLELGALRGALPRGVGFVPWVRDLVAKRRGQEAAFFDRAIEGGLLEALEHGTTTLGEVTTTGRTAARIAARRDPPNSRRGIRVVLFEEAIAFDPARARAVLEHVVSRVESIDPDESLRRRGIAPHAPYTASAALLHAIARYAARHRIPSSIHVSETPEELRMFATGDGELHAFLDELDEVPPDWKPPGCSPVAWLERVGTLAARPLLVHANYLDDDDILRIRRSGSTVIFCPRSHRFFGHEPHPFPRLRAAGVPIALGTDSLASNDSLSMRAETAELAERYGVAPEDALAVAFAGGARAFGRAESSRSESSRSESSRSESSRSESSRSESSRLERGRLAPGSSADLAAYPIEATDPRVAAAELLDPGRADEPAAAVFAAGSWLREPSA